jgi:hypothetical protein
LCVQNSLNNILGRLIEFIQVVGFLDHFLQAGTVCTRASVSRSSPLFCNEGQRQTQNAKSQMPHSLPRRLIDSVVELSSRPLHPRSHPLATCLQAQ